MFLIIFFQSNCTKRKSQDHSENLTEQKKTNPFAVLMEQYKMKSSSKKFKGNSIEEETSSSELAKANKNFSRVNKAEESFFSKETAFSSRNNTTLQSTADNSKQTLVKRIHDHSSDLQWLPNNTTVNSVTEDYDSDMKAFIMLFKNIVQVESANDLIPANNFNEYANDQKWSCKNNYKKFKKVNNN